MKDKKGEKRRVEVCVMMRPRVGVVVTVWRPFPQPFSRRRNHRGGFHCVPPAGLSVDDVSVTVHVSEGSL